LKSAGNYLIGALAYVALPLGCALAAIRPNRVIAADMIWPREPERRLAALAFWAPLLLPAILAPVVGFEITSLWTMSAWALLPVVLLSSPLIVLDRRPVLGTITIAIVLPVVMVAVAPLIAAKIHRNGGTPAQMHSRLLADRVAHEWRRATDKPLRMIGGDSDLAYGVAFYLPGRPPAFPDFNRQLAPWVDVLFGTYHCPEGPETYPLGLTEPFPRSYVAQLVHPLHDDAHGAQDNWCSLPHGNLPGHEFTVLAAHRNDRKQRKSAGADHRKNIDAVADAARLQQQCCALSAKPRTTAQRNAFLFAGKGDDSHRRGPVAQFDKRCVATVWHMANLTDVLFYEHSVQVLRPGRTCIVTGHTAHNFISSLWHNPALTHYCIL